MDCNTSDVSFLNSVFQDQQARNHMVKKKLAISYLIFKRIEGKHYFDVYLGLFFFNQLKSTSALKPAGTHHTEVPGLCSSWSFPGRHGTRCMKVQRGLWFPIYMSTDCCVGFLYHRNCGLLMGKHFESQRNKEGTEMLLWF